MTSSAATGAVLPAHLPSSSRPHLDHKPGPVTAIVFIGLLAIGLLFTGYSLVNDVSEAGAIATTWVPYILLGVALAIALGFEFVNGFHDTANAVATVIYTNSLPPNFAVMWSGFFNFLGVLLSSGAVAFGIISLLPVELILQVGSSAGFAHVVHQAVAGEQQPDREQADEDDRGDGAGLLVEMRAGGRRVRRQRSAGSGGVHGGVESVVVDRCSWPPMTGA